jgi:hypothetical protein
MSVPTRAMVAEHSGGQDINHVQRSGMTPSDGTLNMTSRADEPSGATAPPRSTPGSALRQVLHLTRARPRHRLRRKSRRQPLRPTVAHVERRLG